MFSIWDFIMSNKIDYADLRKLLESDETTDAMLAPFFVSSPSAQPMAPQLRINEDLVEVPKQRGILLNLAVGFLNRWSQRRRVLAYQKKIEQNFTGLRLIAEGDSWFQYPILRKDIIDCISDEFAIHCTSAAGDTLTNMTTGVEDLERLIRDIQPDGLLFSGGGNDIVGEALVSHLLNYQPNRVAAADFLSPSYWRFLENIEYRLTVFFNRLARQNPNLPIFCHGYDWPFPQKSGRWLHPAMEQYSIPSQFQAPILKLMINAYYDVLQRVASKASARVIIVDCRGIIGERSEWFDELHPYDDGYARIAERFRNAIHMEITTAAPTRALRSSFPSPVIKAPSVPKAPSAASLSDMPTPPPPVNAPHSLPAELGNNSQPPEVFSPDTKKQELRYLELELISGNIVNAPSPAYVIGIFEHLEPSGGVKEIDELLGHRLSSLIQAGLFGGKMGEVSLLPIPQQRLMSETIVFAGLGSIGSFRPASLKTVAEKLARVMTLAKINEIACLPIGLSSGYTVSEYLDHFLSGFLDGLIVGDPNEEFYSLQICERDVVRYTAMKEEIVRRVAEGFFQERGFEVHVRHTDVSHQSVIDPTRTRNREDITPFYLEASSTSSGGFEYYLLCKGHGGSITPLNKQIDEQTSTAITKRLAITEQFDAELGAKLANSFLPIDLQQLIEKKLADTPNSHLVVLHDKVASTIPWEALYIGSKSLALGAGISRIYKTTSTQRSHGQTSLPRDSQLNILVIENPTANRTDIQNLPGATKEGDYLSNFFHQLDTRVKVLEENAATRDNILNEMHSRRYDILHYTGHAYFDEQDPGKSGLECYDSTLIAADMGGILVPQLIFFNGCQSGRMRSSPSIEIPATGTSRFQANISLAESLLNNGIPNFIGTYWNVYDQPAMDFAKQFYSSLLMGNPIGLAMQKGRKSIRDTQGHDWANYQHFGDPTYRLRQP